MSAAPKAPPPASSAAATPAATAPTVTAPTATGPAATGPAPSARRPALERLGRALGWLLSALLLALGLGLALFSLGSFASLASHSPLWLRTLGSGELLLGQLVLGGRYAAWDPFSRALLFALLGSVTLGLAAFFKPRPRPRGDTQGR